MGRQTNYEDDHDLVARCQQGDELAFEELVRKYQQAVINLVYRNIGCGAEVEDVAQKIFSKIYFSLPKFDSNRPFFPWLYRIAINQCHDELRRARRRKVHTFSELNIHDSDAIERLVSRNEAAPVSAERSQELHALLHKMLDALPDQQRMALVLRDLEQIPYEKIADILQCSEQAARLKVFRARGRLRELMLQALRRRGKG